MSENKGPVYHIRKSTNLLFKRYSILNSTFSRTIFTGSFAECNKIKSELIRSYHAGLQASQVDK